MGLPIITGIIRTLGKILPGGATKSSAQLGGIAALLAVITAAIEPINELAAAITLVGAAVSGAIAALGGAFGVGRKAGGHDYLSAKAKRS